MKTVQKKLSLPFLSFSLQFSMLSHHLSSFPQARYKFSQAGESARQNLNNIFQTLVKHR
jgi:hypothetical protein